MGSFSPKCETDGRFKQVQCHDSTGYCWCVNENGEKLPDTEIRGERPICNKREFFYYLFLADCSTYND